MKDFEHMDQLLKQALSPTVEPSNSLNNTILNQMKERENMKKFKSRKALVFLLAATLTLGMAVTAFAAIKFLSPKEIAENIGDQTLAKAFDSKDAIEINESVVSGGYNISLHGLVSGKDLSDFNSSNSDINPERTYAVVSIEKEDGSPMPSTQDADYGQISFFISPLIKGQKPWLYNIASLGGGYSEIVKDGIMYRLIECYNVEIFADRGLYLCVSTSAFYDTNAFNYNEQTGEITPKTDYSGANALFDLPLDVSKANYEEGQKYLDSLYSDDKSEDEAGEKVNSDLVAAPDVETLMEKAELIEDSVKEVTYEEGDIVAYEYEGSKLSLAVDVLFKEDQVGLSDFSSIEGEGADTRIIRFQKDAKGVITGMVYQVK